MHAREVAEVEDEIAAEDTEIIWVLEEDTIREPGTSAGCRELMDSFFSQEGWCVGDAETLPDAGVFDDSPFAIGRGFDIVVRRSDMHIVYVTTHGTPGGNENPSGEDVLDAVVAAHAALAVE